MDSVFKIRSLLRPKSQQAFVSLTLGFAPGKSTNEKTCTQRLQMARDEPGPHYYQICWNRLLVWIALDFFARFKSCFLWSSFSGRHWSWKNSWPKFRVYISMCTVYFTSRLSEINCHKASYQAIWYPWQLAVVLNRVKWMSNCGPSEEQHAPRTCGSCDGSRACETEKRHGRETNWYNGDLFCIPAHQEPCASLTRSWKAASE